MTRLLPVLFPLRVEYGSEINIFINFVSVWASSAFQHMQKIATNIFIFKFHDCIGLLEDT